MNTDYKLIPKPVSVVYGAGAYQIKKPLSQQVIAPIWHDFPRGAEKALQESGIKIRFFEVANMASSAYSIKVTEGGVLVSAGGYEGLCSAYQTFLQILANCSDSICCLEINDAPKTPLRAFHIDLAVYNYRMDYLRQLIQKLASLKYNAVVIDYRGMFPYGLRYAKRVDGYSLEEIDHMAAFANRQGITIIPMLPVMRHVGFIWDLEPYIWLGDLQEQRQENLAKIRTDLPEAAKLMQDLARDLAKAHPGPYVFLDFAGGEEDEGYCQDLSASQKEYALSLCKAVHEEGKKTVIWSDILDDDLLERWPKDGVAVMRMNGESFQEERLKKAGLTVWNSYAAVAFPATEVSMRLKSRLKAMEDIGLDAPKEGAFITAYMSSCQGLEQTPAPQLMHGALRMPIILAWEAVYMAGALLWNPATSPEELKNDWPWFYFGVDSEKVKEFSKFMENLSSAEPYDYTASSKSLMKIAAALKPNLQKDILDLAFFYARYRLFNRYISQQFSRSPEMMHMNKIIGATKEMHKIWQGAMGDKLPIETVSMMQRHLFGYVEELARRAMRH